MCRKILLRHILQFLKFCETALGDVALLTRSPIKIDPAEEIEKKHDEEIKSINSTVNGISTNITDMNETINKINKTILISGKK